MWILQEIVSARRIFVICGSRRFSWYTFKNVLLIEEVGEIKEDRVGSYINNKAKMKFHGAGARKDPGKDVKAPMAFSELYQRFQRTTAYKILKLGYGEVNSAAWRRKSMYLLDLLADFHESECSDPRDKVYTLLGITCEGLPKYDSDGQLVAGIKVDYAKQAVEVLADCLKLYNPATFRVFRPYEFFEKELAATMGVTMEQVHDFTSRSSTFSQVPRESSSKPKVSRGGSEIMKIPERPARALIRETKVHAFLAITKNLLCSLVPSLQLYAEAEQPRTRQ
jgi:hypothetical protein